MNEEFIPTLMADLTSVSWNRIKNSPELLALTALDANLFSTINMLKSSLPYLGYDPETVFPTFYGTDDHIAESILNHAQILRRNIAAYYLILRDREEEDCEEIMF